MDGPFRYTEAKMRTQIYTTLHDRRGAEDDEVTTIFGLSLDVTVREFPASRTSPGDRTGEISLVSYDIGHRMGRFGEVAQWASPFAQSRSEEDSRIRKYLEHRIATDEEWQEQIYHRAYAQA